MTGPASSVATLCLRCSACFCCAALSKAVSHHPRRRAEPPRPSLLVGDLEACRAAWQRLKPAALAALAAQDADPRLTAASERPGSRRSHSTAPKEDCDPLVFKFRSMRESLTRERAADAFAVEVRSAACVTAIAH